MRTKNSPQAIQDKIFRKMSPTRKLEVTAKLFKISVILQNSKNVKINRRSNRTAQGRRQNT